MYRKKQVLTICARELRQNMTRQECRLWYGFLQKHSAKFYRQRVIGGFIADFYCHAAKLIIELDGNQHGIGNGSAYDKERDNYIIGHGLRIVRFTNFDIDNNFSKVCAEIDRLIIELKVSMNKPQ